MTATLPAGGRIHPWNEGFDFQLPSLTKHQRKAYIVQYGPAGMQRLLGDWWTGAAPTGTEQCDDPQYQFPVLRAGCPV